MAEEKAQTAQVATKEVALDNPKKVLEESSDELIEYGGFELIESSVDGAKVMNPEGKARRNIFLTEGAKKEERQKLKKQLQLWHDLLSENDDISAMVDQCQEKVEKAEELLKENLKKALGETSELERNYRSLAMFYKNTETDKVRNITIFNADIDRLKDLDNTLVIDKITEELKARHDRLDLRENYSLMVIPGYLGSNKVVEKWAKIAYQNKTMLVTDFSHLDDPDAVVEEFDAANLTGGEIHRSNVMMTCNWLVGREQYEDLDEDEPMYIPPSTALAGKIYSTLIAQPTAGKMHGGLNEVDGVAFPLKKSEISELEKRGLVPMVKEWEKVMAFSAKTLYNGNDIGLQTYSVVRVFDYVGKVIIDFLNRQAFVNWTPKVQKDLSREISKYLKSIMGSDKIIQDYKLMKLEQDPETKRINIDLHITPFFPAKNFLLKLGGTKGDTAEEWQSEYAEQ
ncbi:type VI secretion system contractile sheath protein TssC [Tunicatimonas pelagia]|uniref:type VI secretion system contractile sheath protein TssC n=1 Tax=Tunicatimonas pelagia TaxID=931531 RepID=UPI00266544C2|nr:type VI secretion system contractile sheath protein TssC [Tunicatimonas pelagia]WKN41299.1 type VI secretion system contractile sheath protein TssC [Tunicatimonas pelagia]